MSTACRTVEESMIATPLLNDEGPLPFEQRDHDRWRIDGVATVFRVGGERFGQMISVRTIDYSDRGIGAISHEPIEPGAVVSVGFQAPGYAAKRGMVTSCRPCGEGYRVGIAFEARLAA